MANGQVNHHWLEWNEMASDYIRFMYNSTIPPSGKKYKILHATAMNGSRDVEYRYLVEVEAPLSPEQYQSGMVAQSFARIVLPRLHYPRWHRGGGSITILRQVGMMDWLKQNITTPFLGIRTDRLVYITTNDVNDFTLIKLKYDEYDK